MVSILPRKRTSSLYLIITKLKHTETRDYRPTVKDIKWSLILVTHIRLTSTNHWWKILKEFTLTERRSLCD